jgi:uncharacterized membrane protein YwzB
VVIITIKYTYWSIRAFNHESLMFKRCDSFFSAPHAPTYNVYFVIQ